MVAYTTHYCMYESNVCMYQDRLDRGQRSCTICKQLATNRFWTAAVRKGVSAFVCIMIICVELHQHSFKWNSMNND